MSLTSVAIQVRVLGSCRAFERDVEVYGCRYRYDWAASSTDRKTTLKIRLPSVEFDNSLVPDYAAEIEDVEVIVCCIVMPTLMLQMLDLKLLI